MSEESNAFIPYPVSTLSPPIVPNDLTSFKSRGISSIEKELSLKLETIRDEYIETINHYNWNKLVYSSDYSFEPVVGNIYYLYRRTNGTFILSMISPDEWYLEHIATVRLSVERQFELQSIGATSEAELFGNPNGV
tara:strand:+ start:249 stop:656 length:408 start_codon:yes stop_codon:yes gene_type:complete